MKKCDHCGKEISDNAKFCPYCRTAVAVDQLSALKNSARERRGYNPSFFDQHLNVIMGTVVIAIVIIGGAFMFGGSRKSSQPRQSSQQTNFNSQQKANTTVNPQQPKQSGIVNAPRKRQFGYIKDGETNFRNGPGTDSAVLDVFDDKEQIEILEKRDEWSKVRRSNGQTGWAYTEYVKMNNDRTPGHIKDDETNFRSGPSKNSKVLDVFDNQEKVEVLGAQGQWCRVRRSNGQTGWAFGEYVIIP